MKNFQQLYALLVVISAISVTAAFPNNQNQLTLEETKDLLNSRPHKINDLRDDVVDLFMSKYISVFNEIKYGTKTIRVLLGMASTSTILSQVNETLQTSLSDANVYVGKIAIALLYDEDYTLEEMLVVTKEGIDNIITILTAGRLEVEAILLKQQPELHEQVKQLNDWTEGRFYRALQPVLDTIDLYLPKP